MINRFVKEEIELEQRKRPGGDEKYVACFLDLLKSQVYLDYTQQEQTKLRLLKDEKLQRTLQEQIWMENGKVYFKPDEKRILRILLKLAWGHAGFELDYVNFDNIEAEVWYDFVFNMSPNDIEEFNDSSVYSLYPEVGSRGMYVIQNLSTGDAQTFAGWLDVQNGQYRDQVSYDDNGNTVVKIVIFEFLYCRVVLE